MRLRECLDEALRDVRDLCGGLTLPELDRRSVAETLDMAISAHERRTGVAVERTFGHDGMLGLPAPHPFLICIYRFVQEGLMNAFRHASGAGVRVSAEFDGSKRVIRVMDDGRGLNTTVGSEAGLGLSGLRERVESIGGTFQVDSAPGAGTRLSMILPLADLR